MVREITTYYHTERLHLLRCLKHMLGFWQDPNHPFRVRSLHSIPPVSIPYHSPPQNVYTVCVGELSHDETTFIQSVSPTRGGVA